MAVVAGIVGGVGAGAFLTISVPSSVAVVAGGVTAEAVATVGAGGFALVGLDDLGSWLIDVLDVVVWNLDFLFDLLGDDDGLNTGLVFGSWDAIKDGVVHDVLDLSSDLSVVEFLDSLGGVDCVDFSLVLIDGSGLLAWHKSGVRGIAGLISGLFSSDLVSVGVVIVVSELSSLSNSKESGKEFHFVVFGV